MRFDFSRTVVVAFLSSVYLESYWWLNMSNVHLLKKREKEVCLAKGSQAGCHTRWHGLESHLLEVVKENN